MIPLILPPGILFKKTQKQKKQKIIKIKKKRECTIKEANNCSKSALKTQL